MSIVKAKITATNTEDFEKILKELNSIPIAVAEQVSTSELENGIISCVIDTHAGLSSHTIKLPKGITTILDVDSHFEFYSKKFKFYVSKTSCRLTFKILETN